ncbi:MAG: MtrB/PioB family outer membrane beta-barrel protein, partial [Candidatus Tectomicrobia bacterium]|nr:MtrB/PioB family outer membrane beta-barrel protein [Candidatus Tectomicrobia bacterium]
MKHLKLRNRNGRMKSMAARRAGWISITLLFLLGLFLGTSNGLAAEPEVLGQKLSGSVEVGGRSVAGNTDSSKFNEYRDLKSAPFIDELKLNLDSKDGKRYFEFRTTDPAYRDQNYKLSLGSYNLYDVQFEFDQTPHVLSNTASTSYRYQGNGVFTLENSRNGRVGAAGSGPLAARNTEGIDVSLDRWTGKFGFRYTPVPEWEFRLGFSSERQEGGRPMGLVVGSPGGSLTEVLEPIQYWTHGLSASAEYAREKYNLKFSYDLSLFRNDLDSVTWDYHLEAAPVVRAALYPDNQAHRFSLSGGIHLPMKSRFVGTVSYSLMRQDQDLLPYTINSAIATPNGLPRSSADARANNFLLNLVLTNQAIRNLGLKAHFRYFNRENNTPSDRFFTVRSDSAAQSATGFLSNPQSFHDQSMELEGDWHLLRWATWKLAVER